MRAHSGHAGFQEGRRRGGSWLLWGVGKELPVASWGFQFRFWLTSCRNFCAGTFLGSICRRQLMSAKLDL